MELYYKNLSLDDILYIDDNGVQKTEEWRDIPDYEGRYKVSDLGRVKSLARLVEDICGNQKTIINYDKILKLGLNTKGYLHKTFRKNGKDKTFRLHQLVAISFLNHKLDGTQKTVIDHKNNEKLDNRAVNLQITTNRENASKDVKNKTSRFTGVHIDSRGRYKSQISYMGKLICLGNFKVEEEASEYYKNALKAIEKGEEIIVKRTRLVNKYKGILFCKKSNKWLSIIYINNKREYIGKFNSEEEAFKFQKKYLLALKKGRCIDKRIKTKTSIYKGVYFDKTRGKYGVKYDEKHLGRFSTEQGAFEARENYIKSLNK